MTNLSTKRISRRLPRLKLTNEIPSTERSHSQAEMEVFDRRCYEIFERLRPTLIENHYNWFILIEPNSEGYFLDTNELIAFQKAREKHPQGKFFFFRLNETGICGRI